jgi:hypothetical protein
MFGDKPSYPNPLLGFYCTTLNFFKDFFNGWNPIKCEEGSSYFCKFEIFLLALCVFGILIFGVMRFQRILGV